MKSSSFLVNTLFVIVICGIASAQSGGNYTIRDSTVEGSAHVSSGGTFVSEIRLGQGLAGQSISGQNFAVGGGFYPAPPPLPPLTLPAPPGNLVAAAVSTTQISLTWTDNANNEDGFVIERCVKKNCRSVAEVGQVAANVTTFLESGLMANMQYTYRVRAFNAVGSSANSNLAIGRTLRR